ncbi:MAG: sugar transferase [Oscillospiraceae bacterium]|nr:sugar transferase [Oscillospiraceae bacterium]
MEAFAKIQRDKEIACKKHEIDIQNPTVNGSKFYIFVKRCFDIIISVIAGILLFIPMMIIALLIKLDSKGPALFKQERLGKGGKPFIMYKFRSMCIDAEANGPKWAEKNDGRCTKLGAKLRKSRIDELPQLINIIKGEMSFVGPRPERACFYEQFEEYIPGFHNRLLVQPGLTGHAQVNGGYDLKPEEKILYDMEYIKNRSFRMDLQCILKTVSVIFSHRGAR